LDEEATRQIAEEDRLHRERLVAIEKTPHVRWPELLPQESDRHLKRLTAIYANLANRVLEQQRLENHK
jgi:hypothetical protein